MEKVALIEFGSSHDEVIYPQYQFIAQDSRLEAHLFISEALKPRLFDYPADRLNFIPEKPTFKDYRHLHRELKRRGFSKVVINTASGKKVRNFVWARLQTKFELIGILHHLRKLEKSTTQKLISFKLKKYFFLAEYLQKKALALGTENQLAFFYAGFLPPFPIPDSFRKPAGETWVVIPGQLEYKRRDYLSLLDSLANIDPNTPLRFIALGKSKHAHGDGLHFERELKARGLEKYFLTWDNFVPNEAFYAYLQQADFVLPLIHANSPGGRLYEKQISGAWNMAMAYRVPLLMEAQSVAAEEWKDAAHFYQPQELAALWPKLEELKQLKRYQSPKWELSHQAKAYFSFLQK